MSSCLPVCLCLCDYRDRVLILVGSLLLVFPNRPFDGCSLQPPLAVRVSAARKPETVFAGRQNCGSESGGKSWGGGGVEHSHDYHEPLCIIMFILVSPFHRCSCRSSFSCLSVCVVTPAQLVPAGGTTVSLFPLQLQTSRHTTATLRSVLFVVVLVDFFQLLKFICSNTGSTRNMQEVEL